MTDPDPTPGPTPDPTSDDTAELDVATFAERVLEEVGRAVVGKRGPRRMNCRTSRPRFGGRRTVSDRRRPASEFTIRPG